MNKLFDTNEDIVALATPFLNSALAIVRSSGPNSIEKFKSIFSNHKALENAIGNTIHYGNIIDSAQNKIIDEVMVCLYKAPKSFTGQNAIEVMAHGSTTGIKKILNLFLQNGFRMAEPGEFTLRSFLAGKMDLTKAEAIHELVFSKTNKAHSLAVKKLSGGLFGKIDQVKQDILDFLSAVSVYLDYETEDNEVEIPFNLVLRASEQVNRLIKSYEASKKIDKGVKLVLAGSVNAGKSSLFNLFLKEDRSIVSEYEGTTRDYIEANFELNGILFNLFDTAGLRETENYVEQIGIEKSNLLMNDANIIIYVIDLSAEFSMQDKDFVKLNKQNEKVIFVLNKIDLPQNENTLNFLKYLQLSNTNLIKLSTKTLEGVDTLYSSIKKLSSYEDVSIEDDIIVSSERQKELLLKASASLLELENKISKGLSYDILAFDAYEIINFLGEITGEVKSEDVLENMFKNFCLGK